MIENTGYCRWDDLQRGQRPGRVKRRRSLNTYPQLRHSLGRIVSLLPLAANERLMWTRCSYTSFSLIPTSRDSSRASSSLSAKRSIIFWRTVDINKRSEWWRDGVLGLFHYSIKPTFHDYGNYNHSVFNCLSKKFNASSFHPGLISSLSKQHAILNSGRPFLS
jgi:hypothetical protein